jgi:hypothetical protein
VNVGEKTEGPSEPSGESECRPATGGSREGDFRLSQIGQLFLFAIAAWTATYSRLLLGPLQETMRRSLLNAVVFALGARHFPVGPPHD